MQTYLQSIRSSALGIIDRGRTWDGGLFKLIGDNGILYNLVANRTVDRRLITGDIKSTILSGGTLVAIVFTFLLVLGLLVLVLISLCCRRSRPSSQKYLIDSKLLSRVNRVDQQLPISLRLLLGILCTIVLILSLVPLVLAFATNSRLHASVSETQATRTGTVANQINLVFEHLDSFLENLVPEAREDVKPVIQRTLEMTLQMKVKSQAAYQNEFREVIGANDLTNVSSDLLDRIALYYGSGKSLKEAYDRVNTALNYLKNVHLFHCETECLRILGNNSTHTCRNHTTAIAKALEYVNFVHTNWSEPRPKDDKSVKYAMETVTTFLGNLVGILDGTSNPPDKQQEMKEQKLKISQEFNQNISAVFDKELNSTEFVLNSLEEKLIELEGKVQSARDSLRNTSVRVLTAYGGMSSKFESARFGATTVLAVLLLLVLVSLSTTAAIVLLVPTAAKSQSRRLISSVYFSYAVYAIAIVFVCGLFCLTSYLHTESCRYMYEENTADKYLVPEVNAVIAELKVRAASDANKTDAIPLKRIDRLIGGLLDGCQANQPILQALNAVSHIDTGISNSAEQSLKFKEKGREILRREMSSANLEVLRDASLENKMKSLRDMFLKYQDFNFSEVGMLLEDQRVLLGFVHQLLVSLRVLNEQIHSSISHLSSESTKAILQSNQKVINTSLGFIQALLNVTNTFAALMPELQAKKAVVSVIDHVIASNKRMETYLTNQTLWTEVAVYYYTKHVIDGSTNESKAIADSTTMGFLSSIAKCRKVYNFYQVLIGIPCESLLYPMSILWFCLAWFLWFAFLLSLLVHLSLSCFVDLSDHQQQQQQQQPLDDSMPISRRSISVGNHVAATKATDDSIAAQDPLLATACLIEKSHCPV